MSLANTSPPQRHVVDSDGVQLELMGHVGSPRGVDFVAFELVPDQNYENCITITRRNICFLQRIAPGAVMSVERRSHQPVGPLNFFAPGISMEPARVPISGALCFFDDQFLTKLVEVERDLNIDKIDCLTSIESRRLDCIGQEMFRETLSPGFGSAIRAEAMAMHAALEIARYDGARRCDETLSGGGLAPWQMRRLEDYVRTHLADGLTLIGLAELLDISVRHLSRVVKQAKGLSVHRWVADLRIAEAQRLLSETNLPLHDIARRVAFMGAGAFSTAFRAASGLSPSDFRRLSRKDL